MARRYVTGVLGIAAEDIAIRHLEKGVRFVLKHLDEKNVSYIQPFKGETHATHRRFVYTDKQLSVYETTDEFSSLLNNLATKRILKDLSE
jgi:hypothetical protein